MGAPGKWSPYVFGNPFVKWLFWCVGNHPCLGRFCNCVCPCCCERPHEPFRLRVALEEGWALRPADVTAPRRACYVAVRCGRNPVKTTAVQLVPPSNAAREPVRWYDTVDVEVTGTDRFVILEVMDADSEDIVGTVQLAVEDFYPKLQGSLDSVMSAEHMTRKLFLGSLEEPAPDLLGQLPLIGPMLETIGMLGHMFGFAPEAQQAHEEAGEIVFSLYATRPWTPLPAVQPGMI